MRFVVIALLCVGFLACFGCKQAEPAGGEQAVTAPVTCPVCGGPANPSISTEYQGQKVCFCMEGCLEKFKKDPQKYASALKKTAAEEAVKKAAEVTK